MTPVVPVLDDEVPFTGTAALTPLTAALTPLTSPPRSSGAAACWPRAAVAAPWNS